MKTESTVSALADIQKLKSDARAIRKRLLTMHYGANGGHIGSGLSTVDVLAYIYGFDKKPNDIFILSKGHGASALYSTLAQYGKFSDELIKTYYKDGTTLAAHPVPGAYAEIPIATGSLGHGLPVATGFAFASQIYGVNAGRRVTCMISDGECDEGSVWEAALFAAHHKLDSLTVVIDANGLQGFGTTDQVMKLEPLDEKWRSFGFSTHVIDGHDFAQIHQAMNTPTGGAPRCIVARTVKGRGVSFMENKLEWHYLAVDEAKYNIAMKDLDTELPRGRVS